MSDEPLILLVEDEQDLRENFSDILQIENYRVMEAGDGRQGIACIHQRTPDLIICDVAMPNMTGIEFYQWIQTRQNLVAIPFIFLTGNRHQVESFISERTQVLQKPITIDELLSVVDRRLEPPAND